MSAATHLEIETKFDASADVTIPDLAAVDGIAQISAPVTQDLDAEYFDTAELALLRADIGLRRRRGGDDAGWHLKIARSKGERLEVHEPLDAGEQPPERLRDLVTVRTRQVPLQRVARLRTLRTTYQLLDDAGESLIELADDTVTADVPGQAPTTWREVEVELTGGDRELLAEVERRLQEQGAIPAMASSKLARVLGGRLAEPTTTTDDLDGTAGGVVRHYLRTQRDVLIEMDPAVRIDAEDAVHKMRVATRRLRSALATYRRLLDTDVTEPVRAELKWLGGVLGDVRDAEVIRDHLRELVRAEPPDLIVGPVHARIDGTLDARHAQAHRHLLDELTSKRYLDLVAALDHLPDAVGGERATRPATHVVAEVRRAHRRMRAHLDAARAATGGETDDLLHEVRKAAKRVRYAAESTSEVLGSKADKLAARMEGAQETLGAHQDSLVIRSMLRTLASDATDDGEPTFTYGRLHAIEQHRADRAHADFDRLIDGGWARQPRWMR